MPIKLKRITDNLDDIEETYRPLYVEKDGKFVRKDAAGDVEFEGLAPAAKLEEFRQTNIDDRKKYENELAKYKDVDVEKYRELLNIEKDIKEHNLVKRGELEEVRRRAAEDAVKPVKEELTKKEQEIAIKRDRLATALIENEVVKLALPFGLKKGAVQDLMRRARMIFKLDEEDRIRAYEADGSPKFHLGDPYTVEQFLKDTSSAEDGKHLFEENSGGGGDPSKGSGGGTAGEVNPWLKETWDMTRQSQMIINDRAKAERLAKRAGVTLPPLHSLASRR